MADFKTWDRGTLEALAYELKAQNAHMVNMVHALEGAVAELQAQLRENVKEIKRLYKAIGPPAP